MKNCSIKLAVVVLCLHTADVTLANGNALCDSPKTDDQNNCARQNFHKADGKLNQEYKALLKKLTSQVDSKAEAIQLQKAQRAWLIFRDEDCELIKLVEKGSMMQTMLHLSCLEGLTKERTKQLKQSYLQ